MWNEKAISRKTLKLVMVIVISALILTTMPSLVSAQDNGLELTFTPSNFTLDPREDITFTVELKHNGNPLEGKAISFNASEGELKPAGGFTDSNGQISFTYTAPGVYEETNVTITASTNPFSYGRKTVECLGTIKEGSDPIIVVNELELSKEIVSVDETIEVNAKTQNKGSGGQANLSLFIGDDLEETKRIQIKAGENKPIKFQISIHESGDFRIKVGGREKNIFVEQSNLELSDLNISPKNASVGEEVLISFEAKNEANKSINETLEYVINNVTVKHKQIELQPNTQKTLNFTTSKEKEGVYELNIRDLSGTFVVVNNQETPGFTFALAAFALILALYLNKKKP